MAAPVTPSLRLESWFVPAAQGAGSMRLRLVNAGREALAGFRLAFTTVVQLTIEPPAALVERTSGFHVVAPPSDLALGPGEVWTFAAACGHRPRHANDGPTGAYVVLDDGASVPVRTAPTGRVTGGWRRPSEPGPTPVRLASTGAAIEGAWALTAGRERRLHPGAEPVLADDGAPVVASIDDRMDAESAVVDAADDGWSVRAGSPIALQRAFTALATRSRCPPVPGMTWRGVHLDLARQFFPAEDVDWLIDVAAWRGLNRVHLHLTDDEAWRVPITAYPALTDVGAWRGHGLAIPPLLGSGPAPFGGSYTRAQISGWVARAAAAGIELVPEVDLPGHCFAALAAVPALRDPCDRSSAMSIQSFVGNVLDPGVAATWPFLETVVGELADLFPGPWLHVGGDEVPDGAWSGSPSAIRWAAERGIAGSPAVGAAFMAEIVRLVRVTTGRQVGVWQEAAESGAMGPGDGYVVGWKSADDCRRLAAAGHTVVAAPAERYYLDMAASTDWDAPGAGWAGHSSLADVEAFEVARDWTTAERSHLLGLQACAWTEHAPDRPSLERLLFPRVDAIAAAARTLDPRY
ncbi:MAG: family 20 glycosylhydrolase [Ilumatobacteraceae bacterium]